MTLQVNGNNYSSNTHNTGNTQNTTNTHDAGGGSAFGNQMQGGGSAQLSQMLNMLVSLITQLMTVAGRIR